MDAAAGPQSFSFISLFMQADWVVKSVMVGLILASLGSWAVIIDKLFRFAGLNGAANRFEDQVGSGQGLEEVAAQAGANPKHPLPRMLQAALKEWRDAKAKGPVGEAQAAFLIQRIDRMLDTLISRETGKAEEGLGSLAIVATASARSSACSARSGASCTPSRASPFRRTPRWPWWPPRSPRRCSPPPSA
jgi:biopolymer transport protein TolQ